VRADALELHLTIDREDQPLIPRKARDLITQMGYLVVAPKKPPTLMTRSEFRTEVKNDSELLVENQELFTLESVKKIVQEALAPVNREIETLKEQNQSFKAQNQIQASEIQTLKTQNQVQANEIQSLKAQNQAQANEIQSLKAQNQAQANEIQSLKAQNQTQANEIQSLKLENKSLNDRLNDQEQTITSLQEAIIPSQEIHEKLKSLEEFAETYNKIRDVMGDILKNFNQKFETLQRL